MIAVFWEEFLHIFIDMAPFMVLGLLFVGILNTYIKREWIIRFVGKDNFASVIKASVIGIPLPLCSCGVVPTALELRRSGAGIGAVISFLGSTPQTGPEVFSATYGLLGPFMAAYRAAVAFVTGIVGGTVTNILCKNDFQPEMGSSCEDEDCGCDEGCGCAVHTESVPQRKGFSNVLIYPFVKFLDDISVHLLVGLALAAAINAFVPYDFFMRHGFSSGISAMLLMLVISLPMYLCSTSSIPIALTLIAKGISPGAAFVFLFVGPATNIASIVLMTKNLGKKVTIIYLAVISVMSVGCGLLFDLLGETVFHSGGNLLHAGHHHGWYTDVLSYAFAIVLAFSLLRRLRRLIRRRRDRQQSG